ncbi:MAG: hypothetical protein GF364_06860 [Candidatus Lokiarchaeota archaeon]|nr:hypothetical protein [Candidatus Lokiarchaeota archaeon]
MIPFVRSPEEAIHVQKIMSEEGLVREEVVQGVMAKYKWSREKVLREVKEEGLVRAAVFDYIENSEGRGYSDNGKGLKIYMMAEIPSNIILAEEFCRIFDGFSIGTNDLTQLVFGADRDSENLARSAEKYRYQANSEAIKRFISLLIDKAHNYTTSEGLKLKRKVGICGQAPSDYPEFLQFLVASGIDSISLNFDTFAKGKVNCHRTEVIENKLPEDLRKPAYELFYSYDSIISEIRIPRGRMRYLKHYLEQSSKKDDKLWDIVMRFDQIYELLNDNRESLINKIEQGHDFQKLIKNHQKILSDRTQLDALIAYSNQRWHSQRFLEDEDNEEDAYY